jgi:TPR repeat protein
MRVAGATTVMMMAMLATAGAAAATADKAKPKKAESTKTTTKPKAATEPGKPAPAKTAPASTPAAASLNVRDGAEAWQRGDFPAAVAIWRPLAVAGDPDAAFDLAQAYKLGRGVSTDLAQAKTLYGQAARGGHAQAAANYGLLLFQDGDRANAMPWIQKAADAGDPRAQYVYGTALFNGDLAPRDWPKAYALMARAAAAGLPQATTSLAQMDEFIPAADRQSGLAMAANLAGKPMPPIDRHQMASAQDTAPKTSPLSPVQKVQIAASAPDKPVPVKVASPAPSPKPAKIKPEPDAKLEAKTKPAPKSTQTPTPLLTTKGGNWKVQLGTYPSVESARTEWGKLTGKARALRSLTPSYEQAGAIVRLRAGALADRAAADKACGAAKTAGLPCFTILTLPTKPTP